MKANILTALAAAIIFMGAAVGVQAQDNAHQNQPTSTQNHMRASHNNNNETVTGCLEKGSANDYTLDGQDGRNWQVSGDAMNLGTYVGKEVYVAGTESGSRGRQANASRQTAGADNSRVPIDVLDLAVVKESCQARTASQSGQGSGF